MARHSAGPAAGVPVQPQDDLQHPDPDDVGADLCPRRPQVRKTLGQLQAAFSSCIPTGMHGPTCIFWANLTPFSLQGPSVAVLLGQRFGRGGAAADPQAATQRPGPAAARSLAKSRCR